MPSKSKRAGGLAQRSLRLLFAAAVGVSTVTAAAPAAALAPALAGPPTLEVSVPSQVAVGAPFELQVQINNAAGLAGYEMAVLYDPGVVEFAGVQQRQNDLQQFGRDVSPLVAVDLSAGVSVGLFSCATDDCVTGAGAQAAPVLGAVRLATVVLIANQPGALEIKLDALKFVDAHGDPLAVDLPQTTFTVQAGTVAESPTYAAPAPMWTLTPETTPGVQAAAPGPFDLTGDGRVSFADAMEVAIEWQTLRQHENACGALPGASRDVNHDGCVDVADLQLVAANIGKVKVDDLPYAIYLPLVANDGQGGELAAQAPLTWIVNTTSDQGDGNIGNGVCRNGAGACSLRAAIQEANAHLGPDTITFNIPGGGVQTIVLNNKLPTLTDGGTTIDGYTQPGASVNTDPLADNAQLMVQIQGGGADNFDGFVITSAGNTIRGLALYQLQRSFWIYGSGASNNTIVGCFVGTNAAGTYGAPSLALYAHGFHIEQGAHDNQVGSPALADRNVISGNARHGLGIWHEGSSGNVVQNNIIGLNPAGTNKLPNRKHGLDINFGASLNIFGGNGPNEHNVSAGNDDSGVELSHTSQTRQNQILGNYFGTDLAGSSSPSWAPNLGRGIMIEDGATANLIDGNVIGTSGQGAIEIYDSHTFGNQISNNRIGISLNGTPLPSSFGLWVKGGGLLIGPGNIIAYSQNVGVKIEGDDADNNRLTQNSIFGNSGLGVDVFPRGVNQPGQVPATGPNQGIDFPILQSASPSYVSGTACPGCTVEVFLADSGDGAYGEGQTYLGSTVADGAGNFSAAVSGASQGAYVTANATDSAGNTSEFSLNLLVGAGGGPTPTPGPTATPSPTTYVADTFTRSLTDSWGGPETGGSYTLLSGASAAQDFDVNGSAGTVTINTAGVGREAIVASVNQTSVDITFQVSTDKTAAGDSQEVLFLGRRVTPATMYRGRVRFGANGEVYVQAIRAVGGTYTTLSGLVPVSGVTHAPGVVLQVHGQIVGTNPTTIRMNVWSQGQPEPTGWQYSVSDGAPALQTSGAVGLRALLAAAAPNAPVVFTIDDYLVTSLNNP